MKKEAYRLDRWLSASGYGSRRDIRALIRSGAVTLDGRTLLSADEKIDVDEASRILLHQEAAQLQLHQLLMMNKAAGTLTAMEDKTQPTVADDLPAELLNRKLSPVGRLDKDTEGLLILTNDGELNHRLCSPKYAIIKRYHFAYSGAPFDLSAQESVARGLLLDDGTRCRPAELIPLEAGRAELLLTEGRFHQVKRMVKALGREVLSLRRESIGPLLLDPDLRSGAYRTLSPDECLALYEAVQMPCPPDLRR